MTVFGDINLPFWITLPIGVFGLVVGGWLNSYGLDHGRIKPTVIGWLLIVGSLVWLMNLFLPLIA